MTEGNSAQETGHGSASEAAVQVPTTAKQEAESEELAMHTDQMGRWFSSDYRLAPRFGRSVSYVDVPTDVAESSIDPINAERVSHILPRDYSSQAKIFWHQEKMVWGKGKQSHLVFRSGKNGISLDEAVAQLPTVQSGQVRLFRGLSEALEKKVLSSEKSVAQTPKMTYIVKARSK